MEQGAYSHLMQGSSVELKMASEGHGEQRGIHGVVESIFVELFQSRQACEGIGISEYTVRHVGDDSVDLLYINRSSQPGVVHGILHDCFCGVIDLPCRREFLFERNNLGNRCRLFSCGEYRICGDVRFRERFCFNCFSIFSIRPHNQGLHTAGFELCYLDG
jgi:hypothetical protein